MAGLTDYAAQNALNWVSGARSFPATASRFLSLWTTAPTSDAGTGGTEVSGTGYARVQVAGALTLNVAFTTASTTLSLASAAPAWLTALGTGAGGNGVTVFDVTTGTQVGTVASISGSTVTLTAASSINSSGSTDSLIFSAFGASSASSGTEPSVTPAQAVNTAAVNFAQSTAAWGTVVAFGIHDAVTGGNFLGFDWLGAYKWSPFTCTSASPGVLTCTDQTFVNGQYAVVTSKFGGVLPTTAGSWAGVLTVAGVSGSTFNLGVNTTGTGDGLVRQVIQQVVPINNIVTFSASALTFTAA